MVVNLIEPEVRNPMMLMAPRVFRCSADGISREEYNLRMDRFIGRYDLYSEQGLNVKVLGLNNPFSEYTPFFIKAQEDFERLRPGSVIKIPLGTQDDFLGTLWPRDAFQTYGNIFLVNPFLEGFSFNLIDELGLSLREFQAEHSRLGEGGLVVRDKNLLVVSSAFFSRDYEGNLDSVSRLLKQGYRVRYLPIPERDTYDKRLSKRMNNGHIDTEFNLLFTPEKVPLIIVNQRYYHSFKHSVNALVEDLKGRLHVVPEDSPDYSRRGINFIGFPNGKVALPNKCYGVERFLRDELGNENVLTVDINPLRDYSGSGGGLRCMSNIIENTGNDIVS